MLNRRDFTLGAGAVGAAAVAGPAQAQSTVPFYASVGPQLNLYDLDVGAANLTPKGGVTLPANLQYAWPHPSKKFLYVAASNSQPPSGPAGVAGGDKHHYAIAYKIAADGSLSEHGPRRLLDGEAAAPFHRPYRAISVHRLQHSQPHHRAPDRG